MRNRIKITTALIAISLLGLAFLQQLLSFDKLGHEISEARDLRLYSMLFADELRHSTDEIMIEVGSYVVTSDPRCKSRYGEVLDIREGRKPREREYEKLIIRTLPGEVDRLNAAEETISFMDMAQWVGFSPSELEVLSQAKQVSDKLAELERVAMLQLEMVPDTAEARFEVLELLVNQDYRMAKSEMLTLLRKFEKSVSDRVEANLLATMERSTRIRFRLIGLGILLGGVTLGSLLLEEVRAIRCEDRARRDELTNSSNRAHLHEYLAKVTSNVEARGEIVLLAFIDLNGFKQFNDRFGHKRGDEILREVASCLQDECRERDFVARYGGDEFVIVFVCAMNQRWESIERMKQAIERGFRRFAIKTGNHGLGASVGISIFPCPAATVDAMVEKADEAMYCAKKSGEALAICVHEEENCLAYP